MEQHDAISCLWLNWIIVIQCVSTWRKKTNLLFFNQTTKQIEMCGNCTRSSLLNSDDALGSKYTNLCALCVHTVPNASFYSEVLRRKVNSVISQANTRILNMVKWGHRQTMNYLTLLKVWSVTWQVSWKRSILTNREGSYRHLLGHSGTHQSR